MNPAKIVTLWTSFEDNDVRFYLGVKKKDEFENQKLLGCAGLRLRILSLSASTFAKVSLS